MTGLNGKAAVGTYTLSITNHDGQTGTFGGWSLNASVNLAFSTTQAATPIPANGSATTTLTIPASALSSPTETIPGLVLDLSNLNIQSPSNLAITLTLPDGKTIVPVAAPFDNDIDLSVPSGVLAAGTYTLTITNTTSNTGSLGYWSLQLAGVHTGPSTPIAAAMNSTTPTTVVSTLTIPPASLAAGATITNGVTVDLSQLAFVASSALTVTLQGPSGQSCPDHGPFTNDMVVTGLNGTAAAGTYTLTIVNSGFDTGTLGNWSVVPSTTRHSRPTRTLPCSRPPSPCPRTVW